MGFNGYVFGRSIYKFLYSTQAGWSAVAVDCALSGVKKISP